MHPIAICRATLPTPAPRSGIPAAPGPSRTPNTSGRVPGGPLATYAACSCRRRSAKRPLPQASGPHEKTQHAERVNAEPEDNHVNASRAEVEEPADVWDDDKHRMQ